MSEPERWIIIPNWPRFQHYKERRPVWIKAYTELLADRAYLKLTLRQRGLLHGLWLAYAASGLDLGSSAAQVGRVLGEPTVRTRDIEALNHAGFITLSASKPLAERYQDASPEPRTKNLEEETPLPPFGKSNNNPRRRQETPRMIDINEAVRLIIAGQGWDEATSEDTLRETLGRLKSPGTLDIDAALELWRDERAKRYPQPVATDEAA